MMNGGDGDGAESEKDEKGAGCSDNDDLGDDGWWVGPR